eukprot:CAMPEP_0116019604 /NCGR_PEP_ID=MMETSP0321-20121206/9329_1 /TAXON_ID=163516 /ORGANISM="Leptocylindrus danicus var. danicus, Strain B650" /LENGTH=328 /DNA_ID=CAMNT_0003490193 /DNA_START=248 /DNA_END=1231 /DNA_ORIENTATION=-
MATKKGAGGGERKRRKRKKPIVAPSDPATESSVPSLSTNIQSEEKIETVERVENPKNIEDDEEMKKLVKFDASEALSLGIENAEDEDDIAPAFSSMATNKSGGPLPKFSDIKSKRPVVEEIEDDATESLGSPAKPIGALELPDIRDVVKRKMDTKTESAVDDDEDEDESKPKIKRSDIEGLKKLLEVEPNADTDLTYFEQEEYGTVSALLGEGAKSFLGIPPGPLQIGHFIGLLGLFLCAFVVYPGFPLTNLPSPLRGALQGGIGTIFLVNAVLAGFAVFKAEERGQSKVLWALKTLGVGGLAFDQLTQLPTTAEREKIMSRKGKRAI